MYHGLMDVWKDLLRAGLKEDGWPWDWTTLGTHPEIRKTKNQKIHARVIAKSEGIWAAEGLVLALNQLGSEMVENLQAQSVLSDGARLSPGDLVVEITGNTSDLLALERPFLNLAAYVSGIASSTHRLVEKAKQRSEELV